jgi:hypothetical protein
MGIYGVCSTLLVYIMAMSLISDSIQQSMRGSREGKKRSKRPKRTATESEPGPMTRALTINYPLNVFDTGSNVEEWRAPARYSAELFQSSETDKSWKEISQAQDQEDVWLYENWFYGMEKGVIMESGALNGILFSNSFLFEQYANWTAIHVGKFKPLSFMNTFILFSVTQDSIFYIIIDNIIPLLSIFS